MGRQPERAIAFLRQQREVFRDIADQLREIKGAQLLFQPPLLGFGDQQRLIHDVGELVQLRLHLLGQFRRDAVARPAPL
jgi:hypothetical protein